MAEGNLTELLRPQGMHRRFLEPEAVPEDESEYAAFSCGRVGSRSLQMICFVKADGHHVVLPYVDLHAITSSDPAQGFVLDFGSREVVIEGSNLTACFRYLRHHKLAELIEFDRPTAFEAAKDEPVVHKLTIRKPRVMTPSLPSIVSPG